uniref:Uncharacterized protein n=1 Tax=Rhizophora mucronata TaxID=61149 RepID=A0A2P2R1Z6_RHIMU
MRSIQSTLSILKPSRYCSEFTNWTMFLVAAAMGQCN